MTERDLGNHFSWWVGEVVNVKDPDQSGRVQVRVYGRHDDKDNIPDKDLPWALPLQPVTSPALGKIGTSPLGLLKGSKIIGFWADRDQQQPIIMGSFGKSGDPLEDDGSLDGTKKVDTDKGSIPTAATNQSPPVAMNPYSKLYDARVTINDINNGAKLITSVARSVGIINNKEVDKKLKEPTKPTTASHSKSSKTDILDIVQSVDPRMLSRSLPNAVNSFSSVRNIMNVTSPAGITNMLSSSITGAISNLASSLGGVAIIGPLLGVLNSGLLTNVGQMALRMAIAESMKSSLKNNGRIPSTGVVSTFVPVYDPLRGSPSSKYLLKTVPDYYIEQYYPLDQEPYPGFIQYQDPYTSTYYYTTRGDRVHYPSARDRIIGDHTLSLSTQIKAAVALNVASNLLSGASLSTTLNSAASKAIATAINGSIGSMGAMGVASVLGHGVNLNNIMSLASRLIPGISGNIKGLMSGHLPTSVANAGKISQTMGEFTKNQSLLAKKKEEMKKALGPDTSKMDDTFKDYGMHLAQTTNTPVSIPLSNGSTFSFAAKQ